MIGRIAIALAILAPVRAAAQASPAAGAAAPVATTTVRPGMSDAQVRAAWGEPTGIRTRGAYTYLFYRRACQPACGDPDLVMLERGQVVDAITRTPARRYDGVSSSPETRAPGYTGAAATPKPGTTP
jgi:hypothetical protein